MLDRISALSDAGDVADARFDCGTRHVAIGGRLFVCVDRAIADVLRDAASDRRGRTESDNGDGSDDAGSAQRHATAALDGDDSADPASAAWWIYRSRVAQRLCGAVSVGDAIERDHPLDVSVRLCGSVSDLRRAAHERTLCYSPAGLLRLFERMRARWADCAIGSRLAHLTRPGGPVQRVAARAALGSPRRVSLSSRRRQQGAGALGRSPQAAAMTMSTSITTMATAEPWPVAHMSLGFMYRLQCVINRPAAAMVFARDVPLSPPLADEADDAWHGPAWRL